MLGQDLTGLPGLVGDGALAYLAAQYRELSHGNGVAGLTHLTFYDARSDRVHHPATPLNTSSRPLSRTDGESRTTGDGSVSAIDTNNPGPISMPISRIAHDRTYSLLCDSNSAKRGKCKSYYGRAGNFAHNR